jgi:hypothetical protein
MFVFLNNSRDMGSSSIEDALTREELYHSCDDDDEQGQQLGVREHVLHSGGPFDVPAVDERQNHWNTDK